MVLNAYLDTLIPSSQELRTFLDKAEQEFSLPLKQLLLSDQQKTPFLTQFRIIDLVFEIARSSPAFATNTSANYLVDLLSSNYSPLIRLYQIANFVVQEATKLVKTSLSTITLNTGLGTRDLDWEPEECTTFRDNVARKYGVELNAKDHRALTTLGRLSLWLWQAEAAQQRQKQVLEQKAEQMSLLSVDELHHRLSSFEAIILSQEAQQDLSLELQALCKVYVNSQPITVVEALTPLIVWLNENDSPILN